MKNECSTRNTSWSPPDVFNLYRKRRKVAELVKNDASGEWTINWCRDNPKDMGWAAKWMLILNAAEGISYTQR